MSQMSQQEPTGNTKTVGSNYQNYRWFISLPREDLTPSQLSQHLKDFCKKFTFQIEEGKETGYEHYQIEISLKQKHRLNEVKNLLGFHKAHIEPTKDYFAAINYCSKKETRIEGPYNEKSVFIETPELTQNWQFKLREELLGKPDYRKIIWYIDEEGGKGKTNFALHMYDKYQAFLINNGKFSDIAYALPEDPKIVIFDLPKTIEDRVNYTAIEALKNGYMFSGKYESKGKRFNKCHVVVFANWAPNYSALIEDRWDIRIL